MRADHELDPPAGAMPGLGGPKASRGPWIWLALAGAYAAGVFTLGSLPVGPDLVGAGKDKLWHALAFGIMQLLNFQALGVLGVEWRGRRALITAWVLTCSLGGLLELWQSLLIYRSAEWADAAANTAGALGVAAVQWTLRGRGPRFHAAHPARRRRSRPQTPGGSEDGGAH